MSNIHPRSRSVQQLAVGSSFLDDLNATPVPAGVHMTSIAGRGDAIVPSPRAHLDGAENVIVTVPGVATDHDHLPGSPAAQREIALAVAGMPPTCQTLGDAVVDGVTGGVISRGELSGGVLVAGGTGAAVP